MMDWIEENAFGLFLGFMLFAVIGGGYHSIRLEERKLDILERNGCATIMVGK